MKHARLSASASERWVNCPGSVREAEKAGDSTSFPAAEGTFAHHIAAVCLGILPPQDGTCGDPKNWLGNKTVIEGHVIECDQEMVDGVQFYLDDCMADWQLGDQVWTEVSLIEALQKLDPDFGGTADRIRWRPSTRHLLVADFKYGAGLLVMPEDNRQLRMYALGAMLATGTSPATITVRVVQPRIEHPDGRVRDWAFVGFEILDFAGELIEAAKRTRLPDAPLVPGSWCKKTFCPAARTCPALEKQQHAMMEATDFAVALPYDMDKLVLGLSMIDTLKARIKAMEEFAYHEANRGVNIPGWKIVEKRPTRKISDEAGAIAWAEARSIDPYEPRELKSPAQLEKGTKKADKDALAEYVSKESSGTVLVPVADTRPEAKRLEDHRDFAASGGAVLALPAPAANLFD